MNPPSYGQIEAAAEAWWNDHEPDHPPTRPWSDIPPEWKPFYRRRAMAAILASDKVRQEESLT
jgi:hypothetical protein